MSLYATGIGRIISDITVNAVSESNTVYKFAVGLNEGKDKNGEYIRNSIDCEVWNRQGEVIQQYAKKGDSILLTGTIFKSEWIDKESGEKRSRHIFKVGKAELISQQSSGPAAPTAPAPSSGYTVPYDEDDIPF
jgi:single-stranded DNA-binding protein